MILYVDLEMMIKMKKYFKIFCLNADHYDCMVLCLSYESIFSYMDSLQKEISRSGISDGMILIDQLLISGNGNNRFLSMKFSNGTFDYTSAKNMDVEKKYHQITSIELKNNDKILENSILSDHQISLIKKGCTI